MLIENIIILEKIRTNNSEMTRVCTKSIKKLIKNEKHYIKNYDIFFYLSLFFISKFIYKQYKIINKFIDKSYIKFILFLNNNIYV